MFIMEIKVAEPEWKARNLEEDDLCVRASAIRLLFFILSDVHIHDRLLPFYLFTYKPLVYE